MEEKKILKLLRVRKKHLNKKVSEERFKIRYCRNFSSRKNEFNYFVVNNNIATMQFKEIGATGYIKEHSFDKKGRPVGAKYFIKQGSGKYKRSKTVDPSYWRNLKKIIIMIVSFVEDILLLQHLVGIKKCLTLVIEGKSLSLFRQIGVT